jgi:hypothetical protein
MHAIIQGWTLTYRQRNGLLSLPLTLSSSVPLITANILWQNNNRRGSLSLICALFRLVTTFSTGSRTVSLFSNPHKSFEPVYDGQLMKSYFEDDVTDRMTIMSCLFLQNYKYEGLSRLQEVSGV